MTENFFDEQSEQSQIKAAIVADYFWAWASVIIGAQKRYPQHSQKIAYIDLFAGPGRYQNGAASTPLMIMERAVDDPKIRGRLVAVFNDKDDANTRSLEEEINRIPRIEQLKFEPVISTGEVGENLIKEFERAKLIPAFLFVDPFGYKGLSLLLVQSVLKDWGCDCVFFFNYNRISMGLGNSAVEEHMDALFGKERAESSRAVQNARPEAARARGVHCRGDVGGVGGDGRGVCAAVSFPEFGGYKHDAPFVLREQALPRIRNHARSDVQALHKEGTVANFEYNPADAGGRACLS